MADTPCTIDELLCVCIARQVPDGAVLVQGLNTPLVLAGYILAQRTHAPTVRFASAVAPGLTSTPPTLGVITAEAGWLNAAQMTIGFAEAVGELLPSYTPLEFFRPGQVDIGGNFNNIAFGADHARPRMRLPGAGGIPDVTVYSEHVYLYVPRHSRVTFVPTADFVSGLGHSTKRTRGRGPRYLVSDLGQFDWRDGHMRLTHTHPGVTVQRVQAKTGFDLHIADDLTETTPPTEDEIGLLRDEIDPLGVRKLETLSGARRKSRLREIIRAEAEAR